MTSLKTTLILHFLLVTVSSDKVPQKQTFQRDTDMPRKEETNTQKSKPKKITVNTFILYRVNYIVDKLNDSHYGCFGREKKTGGRGGTVPG